MATGLWDPILSLSAIAIRCVVRMPHTIYRVSVVVVDLGCVDFSSE